MILASDPIQLQYKWAAADTIKWSCKSFFTLQAFVKLRSHNCIQYYEVINRERYLYVKRVDISSLGEVKVGLEDEGLAARHLIQI